MEHKYAALLRMAADNADQLFECDEWEGDNQYIDFVLQNKEWKWRPVKQTKKIKRWLFATYDGMVSEALWSDDELKEHGHNEYYPTKLTWSETEFEVDDE